MVAGFGHEGARCGEECPAHTVSLSRHEEGSVVKIIRILHFRGIYVNFVANYTCCFYVIIAEMLRMDADDEMFDKNYGILCAGHKKYAGDFRNATGDRETGPFAGVFREMRETWQVWCKWTAGDRGGVTYNENLGYCRVLCSARRKHVRHPTPEQSQTSVCYVTNETEKPLFTIIRRTLFTSSVQSNGKIVPFLPDLPPMLHLHRYAHFSTTYSSFAGSSRRIPCG